MNTLMIELVTWIQWGYQGPNFKDATFQEIPWNQEFSWKQEISDRKMELQEKIKQCL